MNKFYFQKTNNLNRKNIGNQMIYMGDGNVFPNASNFGAYWAIKAFRNAQNAKENPNYEGPIITENNLSEEIIDELRYQVSYLMKWGYNSWKDYDKVNIDGEDTTMQNKLYGKKDGKYRKFRRLFSNNPSDFIEMTLGHYNIEIDENGDTIVTDDYNFTPSKGFFDYILAPFLGDSRNKQQNIHWRINLGNMDDYISKTQL